VQNRAYEIVVKQSLINYEFIYTKQFFDQ